MKIRLSCFAVAMLATSAQAQGINGFQAAAPDPRIPEFLFRGSQPAAPAYVSTFQAPILPPNVQGSVPIGDFLNNRQYISIDQFASSQQVGAIQSRQEQFAYFMRRDFDRLAQGIALAAALTVMPPNPGDRFALTVSGAGFDGRGAGSVSGTYRVNEDVLVFGGYARSETQNLVKGGATFSFR